MSPLISAPTRAVPRSFVACRTPRLLLEAPPCTPTPTAHFHTPTQEPLRLLWRQAWLASISEWLIKAARLERLPAKQWQMAAVQHSYLIQPQMKSTLHKPIPTKLQIAPVKKFWRQVLAIQQFQLNLISPSTPTLQMCAMPTTTEAVLISSPPAVVAITPASAILWPMSSATTWCKPLAVVKINMAKDNLMSLAL